MGKLIIENKRLGSYTILYDDIDEPLIRSYRWHISKSSQRNGYLTVFTKCSKSGKNLYLHRLILNPPSGLLVDHINMDRLDNRRCNLRLASSAQNSYNRPLRRDNASGYKGVFFDDRNNRQCWLAQITLQGRRIHIGYYPTKEQAALAYNEAAKKYHGEFARLNEVK